MNIDPEKRNHLSLQNHREYIDKRKFCVFRKKELCHHGGKNVDGINSRHIRCDSDMTVDIRVSGLGMEVMSCNKSELSFFLALATFKKIFVMITLVFE